MAKLFILYCFSRHMVSIRSCTDQLVEADKAAPGPRTDRGKTSEIKQKLHGPQETAKPAMYVQIHTTVRQHARSGWRL